MTWTALSTVDISISTCACDVDTSPQHHTNQLSYLQPKVFDRNVVYIFLLKFALQDLKLRWRWKWFEFIRKWNSTVFPSSPVKPRAEASTTPPSFPSCFCLSPVTSRHPSTTSSEISETQKENAPYFILHNFWRNMEPSHFLIHLFAIEIVFWSNKRWAWSPFCCWTSGHKTCRQVSQESVETPTGSFTWSSHAMERQCPTPSATVLPC